MNPIKKIAFSGLPWIWVTVLVIVIDRYSKLWVADHLLLGEPLAILPIFNLTLAFNTGAAFSFLHSAAGWQNWFLGGIACIISLTILYYLYQSTVRQWWSNIALTLILGGALGNAWDRVLYGHVIDFLDFHLNDWHFAIFNIADSAICVGAVMLFLYWMRQGKMN